MKNILKGKMKLFILSASILVIIIIGILISGESKKVVQFEEEGRIRMGITDWGVRYQQIVNGKWTDISKIVNGTILINPILPPFGGIPLYKQK